MSGSNHWPLDCKTSALSPLLWGNSLFWKLWEQDNLLLISSDLWSCNWDAQPEIRILKLSIKSWVRTLNSRSLWNLPVLLSLEEKNVFFLVLWNSPFFSKDFVLVGTQRPPEFLDVKSQCYLQKSPLFNPWHLVLAVFWLENTLTLKNNKNSY